MALVKQKHNMRQHKQHGFVLIMALVLLAVMTLIGVSSMDSANMELRSMANAQQHHKAFDAGQSLLEYAISSDALTTGGSKVDYQTRSSVSQVVTDQLINGEVSTATVIYSGCSVGIGNSIANGKGFSFNFYNITGVGVHASGKALSNQGQGIRFPAASC